MPAEVTHDFSADTDTWPFDCVMCETGAQNCERDPFSDSASVVRCRPAAISRSSSALPAKVGEAAIACTALTCMTNTIVVELQPWARLSATAAKARRPWPPPPYSSGTHMPSSSDPSAATLSRGKRPLVSTSRAFCFRMPPASVPARCWYESTAAAVMDTPSPYEIDCSELDQRGGVSVKGY